MNPTLPQNQPPASRNKDVVQGLIGLAIGWSVAAFLYFKKCHVTPAIIIASISGIIACCAFFIPPAHHAIQRFFARLAHFVGRALAFVLLVPLFYLFFVPARFIRTLTGKDPLHLKRRGDETTYWEPRVKNTDLEQYRRQF